ncbi:GNAT family N-acetyltransferase [Pedobacter cryoconitis]|uniref:GNAT family N-acetyltransferase n=1 Tax=Pedobacter cryoconitis TaxID=188932 RepID=UPI00161FA8CC|nr:GNAT family N-acetyltransferase [Pedobacter cryoconitis]MBB5645740.1 GNAT superfamily N-acetyltransferase [Pedobacter cryoconitis]
MSKYLKINLEGTNAQITIRIEIEDNDDVVAFHDTEEIGRFEFEPTEDGSRYNLELLFMNVKPDYKNLGIGKSLMTYAVNKHGEFLLPKPECFVNATNKLTDEGAYLINSCFRNRILPRIFKKQYDHSPY